MMRPYNTTKPNIKLEYAATATMLALTLISAAILSSTKASAETEAIDQINITVPSSCTMSGNIATDNEHTASINPNTYQNNIGKTTITTFCNDAGGYAIYAIGYTGDQYTGDDHTKLIGTNTNQKISTGTAKTGTSQWAMRITPVTGTYAPTIENSYDSENYHIVPDTYEKVATYGNSTDATGGTGSSIETTYATYISGTQAADTYTGKVKYTLVHPSTAPAPATPQSTESGKIRYFANVSDYQGTMADQNIVKAKDWSSCYDTDYKSYCLDSNDNEIDINTLPELDTYVDTYTLFPSNFSRTGYGFAGWSDSFDYATNPEAKFYGPNETITLNTADYTGTNPGLSLYAVWVKSQGSLQDSAKAASVCNSLTAATTDITPSLSSVSALTDQRDNNTYAIAKLADGKCWMIENMRLDNTNSDNSTGALAQGYATNATYGNFVGLANPESPWDTSMSYTTANSLYSTDGADNTTNIGTTNADDRFPRYNNQNTASRASAPATTNDNIYSYGNYYTWAAAIADLNNYTSNNASVTTTSICPTGWHLPKGGNNQNTANNEFLTFSEALIGAKPANYDSRTNPYYTGNPEGSNASNKLRSYPNNFIYSSFVFSGSVLSRGSAGDYLSSTAYNDGVAYSLLLNSSYVSPGASIGSKCHGRAIRCLMGS